MLIRKKIGGIDWEVREEFAKTLEEEIIPCIRNFDKLVNTQGFTFYRSRKGLLNSRRFLFYPTSQGDVFIKRQLRPKPIIHVKSVLRKLWKALYNNCRVSREWGNLNQAFWKGGPTPEPLAFGRRIRFDFPFYVTFES